jgi:hypothetical protein
MERNANTPKRMNVPQHREREAVSLRLTSMVFPSEDRYSATAPWYFFMAVSLLILLRVEGPCAGFRAERGSQRRNGKSERPTCP